MKEALRGEAGGIRMIGVETVVQTGTPGKSTGASAGATADAPTGAPWLLARQGHRVPAGTTIRTLLCQAGFGQVVSQIEAGALGLACHGRRAWLDDMLGEGTRVEVTAPINVDAKAARNERVALDRSRRRSRPATP